MTEPYLMFHALTNFELRRMARDLPYKVAGDTLIKEITSQERPGHHSSGNQIRFLNRADLLCYIYGWLLPEIRLIDGASKEELPLLINKEWSCPQLHERVLWRLRNV